MNKSSNQGQKTISNKPTIEINVTQIFEGTQTHRQAFISLIIQKNRLNKAIGTIDNSRFILHTRGRETNSDIRNQRRI